MLGSDGAQPAATAYTAAFAPTAPTAPPTPAPMVPPTIPPRRPPTTPPQTVLKPATLSTSASQTTNDVVCRVFGGAASTSISVWITTCTGVSRSYGNTCGSDWSGLTTA